MLNKLILLMFLGTWAYAQDSTLSYHTTDVNTILGQVAGKLDDADSTAQTVWTDLKLALKAPLASPTFTGTVIAPNITGALNASDGDPDSVIFIDATGLVGIGMTTPVSVLEIKNATPTFAIYDSDIETIHATFATIDSGAVTIDITGNLGRVNYYGSDGDTWNTSINTSDQATFNGASGGYNFDAPIVTTGYKVNTHKIVSDSTLAAGLMYSGVFYVTGAYTVTLPAVAEGMSATFITIGANAVSIDVNASDLQYLDGTALADGDKATNTSTAGDMIVFTYFDATGWYSASNGWADGN